MLRRPTIFSCLLAAACSASGGDPAFDQGPVNGAGASPGAGALPGAGASNVGGQGGGIVFGGGNTTGASGSAGAGTGIQQRIGDTNCVANVRQGEKVPLDIYIMFDQSLSMSCQTASGSTRWDEV